MMSDSEDLDKLIEELKAPALVSKPIEEPIRDLENKPAVEIVASAPPSAPVDVKKYLDQLDLVTDEVLQSCRSDRQEAQDTINLIREEIAKDIAKGLSPGRLLESLVTAVEVKSGINGTAVKMLETAAKTLAATKATLNVNNINVNGNAGEGSVDADLTKLLSSSQEYQY
jgi:hypothetical protein